MSEFKTLMQYINQLRSRYFKALSAFYAYEGLTETTVQNIFGQKKAEENVEVLKRYNNFFMPTKEALRVYFFIELAKLFDASDKSLHLNKVINFTESNLRHLTVEAFKKHNANQSREFLDNLTEEYRGVNHADLIEIRHLLEAHSEALERLRTYRNKWLAHEDIKKLGPPNITGTELRSLFEVLEKIFNILTSKLNVSTTIWDHVERDVKDDVNLVIDHLGRFEPYRIKEIEQDCRKEIEKYSNPNE